MTGRERVMATLERRPADCIPFDIGGTDCSSIHVDPLRQAARADGIGRRPDPAAAA